MADLKLIFALAVAVLSVLALNVNGEYRFVKEKKTWHEAEKDCVKWGGHLAYLNSEAENKYVHAGIKKRGFGNTWTGLNDIRCEGKWTVPIQYSNWNRREPNGKRLENCGHMYTNTGLWNDINCQKSKFSSVCQIGPGKYIYNKVKMNHRDAHKQCVYKHRGALACIESAAENMKILAELKKRGFGNTWIGFDDEGCEGNWECPGKWGNWNKGEPNGKRKENCIMIYSNSGKWNDWGCGNKASYVCQKGEGWSIAPKLSWTTTTKVVYKWVPGDEQKAQIEEEAKDVPQEKPEVEEAKSDDKEE